MSIDASAFVDRSSSWWWLLWWSYGACEACEASEVVPLVSPFCNPAFVGNDQGVEVGPRLDSDSAWWVVFSMVCRLYQRLSLLFEAL